MYCTVLLSDGDVCGLKIQVAMKFGGPFLFCLGYNITGVSLCDWMVQLYDVVCASVCVHM